MPGEVKDGEEDDFDGVFKDPDFSEANNDDDVEFLEPDEEVEGVIDVPHGNVLSRANQSAENGLGQVLLLDQYGQVLQTFDGTTLILQQNANGTAQIVHGDPQAGLTQVGNCHSTAKENFSGKVTVDIDNKRKDVE